MKVSIRPIGLVLKNACIGACLLAACSSDSSGVKDAADAPARRVLLKNMATRVIAPTYADFVDKAEALSKATDSYASSTSPEGLTRAQSAFKDAMRVWQRAEVLQIGPAARVGSSTPGGAGFRERIYFWPNAYPCGVDVALVEKTYADGAKFIDESYPNVRGMAALERLLFAGENESACPSDNAIIKSGAWGELVAADIAARRAAYAKLLAGEVHEQAIALKKAFATFTKELTSAGNGSKLFDTTQDALNAVSDALFYVDVDTKDMKLAEPLGLTLVCDQKRCPAELELPLSSESKQAVVKNLEALRDLFLGLPPSDDRGDQMWGFADLLSSLSQDKLAAKMTKAIEKAIAETSKIEPSLEEEIAIDATDPASDMRSGQADRAYAAIQELTTLLKTEFVSALSLKLPVVAASDND